MQHYMDHDARIVDKDIQATMFRLKICCSLFDRPHVRHIQVQIFDIKMLFLQTFHSGFPSLSTASYKDTKIQINQCIPLLSSLMIKSSDIIIQMAVDQLMSVCSPVK